MKKYPLLAITLSLLIAPLAFTPSVYSQYEYNTEANYSKYYDKGIEYYNQSQYTNAIEQFTQALKLAPDNAPIRNNLAVSYISRGTYFHNNVNNYEEAANNYRDSIFYLEYDAPTGAPKSPNAEGNLDIAIKNLNAAIQNLGNDPKSPSYHFKKAKELRTKGMFRGSIVEYFFALKDSPDDDDAYEAIGDMYRILQNNERASIAYGKAIKSNKNNAKLYTKAGLAYEKNNDLNKAIDAYNNASTIDPTDTDALSSLEKIWKEQIKLNPRNAAAHANLGTVLQKKGELDAALAQYNTAELIDPNNITVRLNIGTLYQAKGDLDTAIKAYDTILSIKPNNVLALYYKATALKQKFLYTEATNELQKILKIEPNNNLAKKELVEIAKKQGGNNTNLIDILKDLASKDPTNAQAQYDVAFEAHSKGDLDLATIYYKKTIYIDPRMADAYSNLGAALIAQKEYSEATEMLNKASELDPTNDTVQKLLSEAKQAQLSFKYDDALKLHQEGKISEAIKKYEEALEEDPNNPELLINLGAAYQTDRRYDNALSMYDRTLNIDPKSHIAYYYKGTIYHTKEDLDSAIKNYNKAIELEPGNQQYLDALKTIQSSKADKLLSNALDEYNKKAYNKAKILIDQALQINPNNAMSYYYMGIVMEAQNSVQSAIANYKKATNLDPKLDSAYYALGIALDKVNDKQGAKDAFQKYINLVGNNDDAFVKYAKERLKQL